MLQQLDSQLKSFKQEERATSLPRGMWETGFYGFMQNRFFTACIAYFMEKFDLFFMQPKIVRSPFHESRILDG